MKKSNYFCMVAVLIITSLIAVGCAKDLPVAYSIKKAGHKGGDLTPPQAYKWATEDAHVFIVDVRTRPEHVLVGHPTIAYHVPVKFWTGKHASKGYGMKINENFSKDLKKRFNPETDTLIFMCRSGSRSCEATNLAALEAGWPTDKIYNMMGGFEGDKVKDKDSVYYGKRMLGGWKNEGLPWTYKIDSKLAYLEAD
ncbi:rhodanese-like domain-containing protein [Desulfobacter latus]|uniref:Sulfurtransferase n=1 Tax=Desulfobacter latus TaxID=2292 RepID=A0A850T874_9BACT|nr:rhodanese-like domain-containing protein [Desulfobacter latus]NWH04638.1 sulfurtransferase [Desulfobacter latus]